MERVTPMKIAIIGPVAPFQSGIARHTTALAQDLSARDGVSVSVFSFSTQYPKALYPGENEKDPDGVPPEGIETTYRLNAMNPLSWRKTVQAVTRLAPDLCILPAWTFFLAPCFGWIAWALGRRDYPVTMIVHNAVDHEASAWKSVLLRFQLSQAHRFVTHNSAIAADLGRLVPATPIAVSPHPVYDDYPEPEGRLPRERDLELLFFGLIRPYKGLDIVLEALAASGRNDVRLSVVGEFWDGREDTEALINRLSLQDKVDLIPRYVRDAEAAEYFARSDALVAPYRTATGSGVVALAQWYCRPVIASDVPGLAEAVEDGRTGWVFPAGDTDALADLLKTAVTRSSAAALHPALEAQREHLSWAHFGDVVLASPET